MKKFLIAMMVMFTTLSFTITDAEARRMGGGGSFGKQSRSFSPKAPSQFSKQNNASNASKSGAAGAGKAASPWRGMLGGALLGLGLGALLSQFGIGGALASMISSALMIGLLIMAGLFIYRMLMRRKQGGSQAGYTPAYAARSSHTPEIGSSMAQSAQPVAFDSGQASYGSGSSDFSQPAGVPADFDVPGFLRNAKTYFIRLQASWDSANVNDIREFSTPEMFAELQMQLHERGASANHTDVVSLDAELLGIDTSDTDYLASVQFAGMIRESENANAEAFSEIWNLVKPINGGGWLLAGIQQVDGDKPLTH